MKIERYGIELRTLDQKHLQNVREWRNRDQTRSYMEFKERIDEESQKRWFEALDQRQNLCFTYHEKGQVHGFLQLKNISLDVKTAEAGIIHGESSSYQSTLPIRAILVLMETAFDLLGLQTLKAKIKRGNQPVEHLNQKLGYLLQEDQELHDYPYYEVSIDRFSEATGAFRRVLTRQCGPQTSLEFNQQDSFWLSHFQSSSAFQLLDPAHFTSNA